ncbi:MAG: DEAD/DEAH box helicase [Erysipelotrichaceae bacterium]|nr:DEAD/DEAH box helicase [Erysipelotrichaceae bacterium]
MSAFLFVCPICGNRDPKLFGIRNGKPYCRCCLLFRGQKVSSIENHSIDVYYHLDYELSNDQIELSDTLLTNFMHHQDSLVHAVCGSGKTEIVLRVIAYAISHGLKVGFTVPRRDVIIELYGRFKNIFKTLDIALIYGGHTTKLNGDLVCCTTHQLFRFDHFFDLLILDEVDAFPFNGNDVLNSFFKRSIKGNYIMMSATPSKQLLKNFNDSGGKIIELYSRFHRYPLPVPELIIKPKRLLLFYCIRLIKQFEKQKKQVFIFTPTIQICEELYDQLKLLCPKGNYVHSKNKSRSKIIEDFRNKKYHYLVTTAILERGVTVINLQVIIFLANHPIYSSYSLVQISGRVGRKKEAPEGRVVYLASEETKSISQSIRDIQAANKNLQNLFKTDT